MAPIHALPLIPALTPRNDIKMEPGKRKLSIEAIFAIIGVGVAMLGIALTLNRKRWLCTTRRQNTTSHSNYNLSNDHTLSLMPLPASSDCPRQIFGIGQSSHYMYQYERLVVRGMAV
ncbi:hypothetical protein IQ07DRAFT_587545 [Pyrenochaeta sp. DS3sAY3a]|nr:hypothetical protein IQ07DRAFT_587545 [Pyrenochaeta sp. DS3sAY3a]